MFLMGISSNCSDTSSSTKRGKKRARVRAHFAINGASLCRETCQLFFDVKRAVLYALIQTVNRVIVHRERTGTEGENLNTH
ncbi:hypothetical protein DPMN_123842 [Dreissena polymorpha]|uniref:Uncharacterized protein n=1 Tax=Dreissena polymorpha TaxID=45954 RepID=A0A9D4GSD6_DREPO|nr:hypothetical protein DPMN_123842 [Dreissena polymorpha]